MAAAEDQEMVEAVGAHGPHPPLRVGVRVRRPHRRPDHPHALGTEHLVEPAAELRVPVMDKQPERLIVAELHQQVASLLGRPGPVRVSRARDVLDPPRRERDEEQNVDPLQKRGLDRQEVARQRRRRLLTQKRPPRHATPVRRRRNPRLDQHSPHRRRRHRNPKPLELPDDPLVTPARVLPRQPEDQRHDRRIERRPPEPNSTNTSTGARPADGASQATSPAAPRSTPTTPEATTGSTQRETPDRQASTADEPTAAEAPPTHAAAPKSRDPSTAPAAPQARPDQAHPEPPDRQTTRATDPPSRDSTTRAEPTDLAASGLPERVCGRIRV